MIVVWGAGGHARVVLDAISLLEIHHEVVVIDDDDVRWGSDVMGTRIVGGIAWLAEKDRRGLSIVPSIGSNNARLAVVRWCLERGIDMCTIVHPSAVRSGTAKIENGCFLAPGAIVNANTILGPGVIVNTGASVDHDCVIGAAVHIGPGARLCGGVTVGDRALIGVGASVIPGVSIGAGAVVGAGAAVVSSVGSGETVVGVPARKIEI